ncbi:hypothetical protein K431DRAFT_217282 [Polychaeton citri CBS 116435]|uniref:Zn(2)-C6 fungal-type domain-containing protein n=1 Tax=Polychaeton citri CBS 116435 TaxID=1314669 RepID=A0A9P4QCE1_9PEZI|nr:hypothetical protein K431DRAFT_217282 [Polychaeton citri CBS 116435]
MTPTTPYPQQPSSASSSNGGARSGSISQQHAEGVDRARAYKSRNKRPCDFCRYKKAACHLESQPPCELCIRYNKECTFVESPAKRRRPNESQNGMGDGAFKGGNESGFDHRNSLSIGSAGAFGAGNGMDMQHELLSWEGPMHSFQLSTIGLGGNAGGSGDFTTFDPALYGEPGMHAYDGFDPMSASTTMGPMDSQIPSQMDHRLLSAGASPSSQPTNLDLSLPVESTSAEPSLDHQASSSAQLVGFSGENDPYLLSRYRYDQYNETTFASIRMRKMNPADSPSSVVQLGHSASTATNLVPAFFSIQHNALASKAQPPERTENLHRYRREVEDMVSREVGNRLVGLFYKYVQPYFPILSREQYHRSTSTAEILDTSHIPTCILAAIYGHALPYCTWDEKLCVQVYTPPSADSLFRIAWLACLADLHTPTLAVLQTLLLLVQRRPTNKHVTDTPFKWIMMTTAVSIAQTLGLNRDPGFWSLPHWETTLRRRLAWATFVQDKWLALNTGRSSHIKSEDWDVDTLTPDDFEEADLHAYPNGPITASTSGDNSISGTGNDNSSSNSGIYLHFAHLCELSLVVDDILHNLFSVKAARRLQSSLEATLDVAKPLRLRLTEWYQNMPPGHLPAYPRHELTNGAMEGDGSGEKGAGGGNMHSARRSSSHELDGDGSLHLAYITAKIELFRAMLRPRVTDGTAVAVSALRTGAMAVAKEVVEFIEGLNARELEAFWASYSRANFTICSSFIKLLYVTAPTVPDAKECLAILNKWRALLRIKSRSCDLLNLALLNLDVVFFAGVESLIELSPAADRAWKEAGGTDITNVAGAEAKQNGEPGGANG